MWSDAEKPSVCRRKRTKDFTFLRASQRVPVKYFLSTKTMKGNVCFKKFCQERSKNIRRFRSLGALPTGFLTGVAGWAIRYGCSNINSPTLSIWISFFIDAGGGAWKN